MCWLVCGLAWLSSEPSDRKCDTATKPPGASAQSEKLRALGQMASGIAHDLNQSLMLVASYSELARQAVAQDPPNLPKLEDLLMTTTQAVMDGGETVKRLLLFTRAGTRTEQPTGGPEQSVERRCPVDGAALA